MTCGPYRPITLKTFSARIAEVHTCARVSESLIPNLKVAVELAGTLDPSFVKSVKAVMTGPSNEIIMTDTKEFSNAEEIFEWEFLSNIVKLWWPVGYGDQHLYTLEVSLLGAVC